MKFLSKSVFVSTLAIYSGFAAASHLGVGEVSCLVNGEPTAFVHIPQRTVGMHVRKAALDGQTALIWSYSPYYGKGGAVDVIRIGGKRIHILNWDSETKDDVLSGSVNLGEIVVDCQVTAANY